MRWRSSERISSWKTRGRARRRRIFGLSGSGVRHGCECRPADRPNGMETAWSSFRAARRSGGSAGPSFDADERAVAKALKGTATGCKGAGSAWDFGRRRRRRERWLASFEWHSERRWDGRALSVLAATPSHSPASCSDHRRRAGLDALLLPGKAEMDFRRGCSRGW